MARRDSWKKWSGLGLIGLSGVWFALIFLVQFAGLGLAARALLSTTFLLLMEGTFYVGIFPLGKQVMSTYWRSIRLKARILIEPGPWPRWNFENRSLPDRSSG